MATLVIDRGVYSIRWQEDKSRKTISLPGKKFAERTAKEMVRIVEKLLYYRENPSEVPDKPTLAWLKAASPIIQGKLASAGLVAIPQRRSAGELCGRNSSKPKGTSKIRPAKAMKTWNGVFLISSTGKQT